TNSLTQSPHQLRNFATTKEKQHNDQNDDDFIGAKHSQQVCMYHSKQIRFQRYEISVAKHRGSFHKWLKKKSSAQAEDLIYHQEIPYLAGSRVAMRFSRILALLPLRLRWYNNFERRRFRALSHTVEP